MRLRPVASLAYAPRIDIDTLPGAVRADPAHGRWSAPLVGAVDAALTVALPVGVLVLAGLVAWAGLGAVGPWTAFVAAAADVWFLGHGVDVVVAAVHPAFPVTLALLGPAMVTALAGARAGRRAGRTAAPALALAAGLVVVLAASVLLLLAARAPGAGPDVAQAVVLPALVYGVAALTGLLPGRRPARRGPVTAGFRGGAGAVAAVLAAAGVAVAVLLALHLPAVVGLYESSSAGIAGGLALTVLQIAALPTVVVWAAAWFTGAGFALGAGSSVGPLGTAVGPLPALPLLGALPQHVGADGLVGVLVPVLAGFGVGVALKLRGDAGPGLGRLLATAVATGITAGVLLGLLSAASAGAVGPGRLASVGPDAFQVAWRTALEVGPAAFVGAAVVRRRSPEESNGRATADAPR